MAAWRRAYSLDQLLREVNGRWPARDKASDGTIGDAAHASTWSDHNPTKDTRVVCATDIDTDLDDRGARTMLELAEYVRLHPHRDLKYWIFSGRMFSAYPAHSYPPFTWRPYGGSDPHTNHSHVSVGVGLDGRSAAGTYDHTDAWLATAAPLPTPSAKDLDMQTIYVIAQQTKDGAIAGPERYVSTDDLASCFHVEEEQLEDLLATYRQRRDRYVIEGGDDWHTKPFKMRHLPRIAA